MSIHSLINNIPQSWKTQINENPIFILENKLNVICNIHVKELIKTKKGSRVFYDIFVGVNDFIPQGNGRRKLGTLMRMNRNFIFSI